MKKSNINKRSATSYLAKIGVLSAFAAVLHIFARFPILPAVPYLDMDFSAIPSLLGGFALGPAAAAIIEAVKIGIKLAAQGSNTGFIGDLSNLICSLSLVVPASFYYKYHKTRRGAYIGLLIGFASTLVITLTTNYFIIFPLYGKLFMPALLDKATRAVLVFGWGLLFNVIKGVLNCLTVALCYKRLSGILHLERIELKKQIFISKSVESTARFARRLARRLTGGEIILLDGELGAGKTTFTKALGAELGVKNEITSPTFTIIKEYEGRLKLYHIDMYRVSDVDELSEIGVEDCFEPNAVTVIEWNKLTDLKGKIIKIKIQRISEKERRFILERMYK